MPKPNRAENGYRLYQQSDVERLCFIRRCRDLQIPLEEIKKVLGFGYDEECEEKNNHVDDLIAAQLARVKQAKSELEALEQTLKGLLEGCNNSHSNQCNILKNLRAN